MGYTLRPYQQDMIHTVREVYGMGKRRVTIQLPSGGGKTLVGSDTVRRAVYNGWKVLYVVPSEEIFDQTSEKLTACGVLHERLQAGLRPEMHRQNCLLAMSHTINRRGIETFSDWEPHLIVLDELHKLIEQHMSIVEWFPEAWILGMTATPVRTDQRSLALVTEDMVVGPSVKDLQHGRYLVPDYTFIGPSYATQGPRGVAKFWMARAKGRRTITFCVNTSEATEVMRAYRELGIRAVMVTAKSSRAVRNQAVTGLRNGKYDVVVNVGLFVEGLDVVEVECVTLAMKNPTSSLSRYIQQLGRAMRVSPASGKRNAFLFDHARACFKWGLTSDERNWGKNGVVTESPIVMLCNRCSLVFRPSAGASCPICAAEARLQKRCRIRHVPK